MKIISIVLVAFFLYGCASVDFYLTQFEPVKTDSTATYYKYTSFASAEYPENSKDGEAIRLGWLNEWMQKNGMGGKKYEIIDRTAIKKNDGLFGTVYVIYYQVKVPK